MLSFSAGPVTKLTVYLCLKLSLLLVEIMMLFSDVTRRLTRLGPDPGGMKSHQKKRKRRKLCHYTN